MNKIPVLVLIFNRPKKFERIIKSLRKIKPKKIYIFANGPRDQYLKDIKLCIATRKLINKINWNCKIHTNFQKKNLGINLGIYTGISWFFKNVKFGIVLEDDCIPNLSFFKFVNALEKKYSKNKSIGIISGNNFLKNKSKYDYFYTKWSFTWGWATWRRNWNSFDFKLRFWKNYRKTDDWKKLNKDFNQYKTFTHIFNFSLNINKIDFISWDYRWMLHLWFKKLINIVPKHNLVKNIGFDSDATHTFKKNNNLNLRVKNLKFPLTNTNRMQIDKNFDDQIFYKVYYSKKNFFLEYLKNIKFLTLNKINE